VNLTTFSGNPARFRRILTEHAFDVSKDSGVMNQTVEEAVEANLQETVEPTEVLDQGAVENLSSASEPSSETSTEAPISEADPAMGNDGEAPSSSSPAASPDDVATEAAAHAQGLVQPDTTTGRSDHGTESTAATPPMTTAERSSTGEVGEGEQPGGADGTKKARAPRSPSQTGRSRRIDYHHR
jgi:hypothetical protein